ncbi:MAG: hypothetical protein HYV27_12690 [Candidatus Hydrogenedentes bacterium]|nr:hypothetical protein [Candidatus Hydrogenedentota bacterium]
MTASHDGTVKVWDAVPWRIEDLPGEGDDWEERYALWQAEQYRKSLKAEAAIVTEGPAATQR